MAHDDTLPPGPDLACGVPLFDVPRDGVLVGHVDGVPVLLSRSDDGVHAVGGVCTHYGAPLGEGLVVDGCIRCPWHHARFSLRSGAALRAPAFAALPRWRTERVGDTVFVRGPDATPAESTPISTSTPKRIVIIGGGAAGFAAAQRLRELGFDGGLTLLSADNAAPCDRPNLSKDYLAGTAPEDWIPLRGEEFYAEQRIDLRLDCEVRSIDTAARRALTTDGAQFDYDGLLIATGAEPRRLPLPGFDPPNVFALRSLGDARAIIAACATARTVAFVGAGFIGLEAAAALRARGLRVHVIAPEAVPLERVLGAYIGNFLLRLHRKQGVMFHLQAQVRSYDGARIVLDRGESVPADIVVVGVGVTPRSQLAEEAGINVRNGILVDTNLRTSIPGVYAAGDVARYPHGADDIRVEHWVHAQRQGRTAAANLIGRNEPFTDVPFFWTHHYGVDLRCIGLTAGWDEIRLEGDLDAQDFLARYYRAGTLIAATSVGRDRDNLRIEVELEHAVGNA